MGNNMVGGRKKKTRVMKMDGETMKLKTPIQAVDLINDYPDHVLMDYDSVKRFGIRAKPLDPQQHLQPNRTYFLLQLPEGNTSRRVNSGIHMGAKDRLELLMLSRRAVSDLSSSATKAVGPMRVKMRLPKAQLDKLLENSKDENDVAQKIVDFYVGDGGSHAAGSVVHGGRKSSSKAPQVYMDF